MYEGYLFNMIIVIIVLILLILLIRMRIKHNNEKVRNELNQLPVNNYLKNLDYGEDNEDAITVDTDYEMQEIEPIEEERIPDMKTSQKPQTLTFSTRIVPPHGKITKENFKEFAGTRILVAEDNLINQKVIQGLLADTGIKLSMADDGQDALDILLEDSDFSMILMDAHMPRVDGFEATRTIRNTPQYDNIPIVALSGDIAAYDIEKMKKAGMQEHLAKPLKISALYDILYAYSKASTPKKLIKVEELNTKIGLEICGNDEKFYKEILNEFVDMYENSTHKLGEYLDNNELQKADELLLDIIGLTANLGADSLYNIAQDIKVALKDTEEASYLTLVEHYKMQLDNLIEDIKKYGYQHN